MRLLILDNYDSFTWNLVHLVEKLCDLPFDVIKNDGITLSEVSAYDKIILSPGPGLPANAGIMPELIRTYHPTASIFGVCLGLQAIGEAFGCQLKNLNQVYHGVASPVHVNQHDALFKNCPATFNVGRYHSWVIDENKVSTELQVIATDANGLVMAARHKHHDVCGVQFHPESILSEHGETILKNWLASTSSATRL
ncbi:MAG: aminodeoxychorismate/anthranilate synthase component II [Bacteroidia bacterium]|nr:aminodeoxychorismate/anthranilate synthase component II [Bacteroidia bacterium]